MLFTAPGEYIKASVMDGQRPDIRQVEGPESAFARSCIEECWNQEAEQRPTFGGEIIAVVLKGTHGASLVPTGRGKWWGQQLPLLES